MKAASYVVAAVGLLAIIAGAVIKFATHHHHGVEAMVAGAVLLVIGIIGAFVLKPKAQAA